MINRVIDYLLGTFKNVFGNQNVWHSKYIINATYL